MDTTSTFLEWVVHYMVNYPEVQEKLFEEIKANIGFRPAGLADKSQTPYTVACIEEIMR